LPTPNALLAAEDRPDPGRGRGVDHGVVGYVLRNSTPSRFMISAIAVDDLHVASPWRRGAPLDSMRTRCAVLRRQAERLAAELFGRSDPS
jgi:hypothetical protein